MQKWTHIIWLDYAYAVCLGGILIKPEIMNLKLKERNNLNVEMLFQ